MLRPAGRPGSARPAPVKPKVCLRQNGAGASRPPRRDGRRPSWRSQQEL